jgi:hypothetical protein
MIFMGIVGFNFRSINAHASDRKTDEKISVNSTPSIEDITEKELNVPGLKDVLSIEFSFLTSYEPEIGGIKITGEVLYQTEDTKKILDMWAEKKLESKMAVEVLNTIFKKSLTKAITLADELRLPQPLTFPIVKTGTEPPKDEPAD